jgi:hypothetical protein
MSNRYIIDPPSPFAPPEELEAFLREMATLDQEDEGVKLAVQQVQGYIADQKSRASN